MARYDFLIETYSTERLKTLSMWSQIPDERMDSRPEPRGRTSLEHMVHQCLSEDGWMTSMLGITADRPVLPAEETRASFINHYAQASSERLRLLAAKPDRWFEETTQFFGDARSHAWVLVRRFTHSAHHRGQLTAYLRSWGVELYSTYGPTADTGGLAKNGAHVIYPFVSLEDLLAAETQAIAPKPLPGPGELSPTERENSP